MTSGPPVFCVTGLKSSRYRPMTNCGGRLTNRYRGKNDLSVGAMARRTPPGTTEV